MKTEWIKIETTKGWISGKVVDRKPDWIVTEFIFTDQGYAGLVHPQSASTEDDAPPPQST
jgi:hypothetical protein